MNDGTLMVWLEGSSFYELFLARVEGLCRDRPRTVEELVGELDLTKAQVGEWLKRAVKARHLKKLSKPVRYRWEGQGDLFGGKGGVTARRRGV